MSDIRVLIVEDDPFIAMDIESALAAQLGDRRTDRRRVAR